MQREKNIYIEKCLSVRLSVCLFVKRVNCDKTEERPVHILYYTKDHLASFWEEEWMLLGDPFCMKFWFNRHPLERSRQFWTDILS